MARNYAQIKVSIWSDDDFRAMSPQAQHLYFVILTSATTNVAGVADWRPKRIASLAGGWTEREVRRAAQELADANYIVIDDDTEEVAVRTFIRHDGILRSFKSAKGMATCWHRIYSTKIKATIAHECRKVASGESVSAVVMETVAPLLDYPCDAPSDTPSHAPSDGSSVRRDAPSDAPTEPPSDAPTHSPTTNNPSRDREEMVAAWETFWDLYPRKVGKKAAERAFLKAARTVGAETLVDGAARLASDPNLPDPKFIPHAATWLSEGRWDDEPYPEDISRLSRQDQVFRRELARIEAMEAAILPFPQIGG